MRKLPAVLRGPTLFLLLIAPVVLSRSLDGLWSLLLVPFLSLSNVTAQGEVWRYANQGWKRHVPGYGAFARVEEQFVLFGADGLMIKTGTEDYGNAFQEPWRRAYGTN